jgi:glucosamine-phosphate N-acetyltransferase
MSTIQDLPQPNGTAAPAPAKDLKSTNTIASEAPPNPTPSDDDIPLFSPSLISPSILSLLPENYTIRPLRRADYHNGYLDVLRVLTSVGDVSYAEWSARYDWMARRNDEYFLLVVCDGENRIVGTGALIVERKFIHSLGLVGHIEDIAVQKDQQGLKLGLRIIQSLDYVAAQVGCYKVYIFFSVSPCRFIPLIASASCEVFLFSADMEHTDADNACFFSSFLTGYHTQSILDCSEVNEGFYLKCGFRRAGLEMAHYYD